MRAFSTKTDPMTHQLTAADKVSPSRVGALFMGMGTGKSRTAIELTRRRQKKIDHTVWFCPVSLKETVRQEILKHTDSNDIYVFDDKTTEYNLTRASWHIVGVESMSSSDRVAAAANRLITEKSSIILDESDMCKTYYAKRTERITLMSKKAQYRLAMTGTPIGEGIVDLYAQMYFLSPKILGYNSFYSFAANHLEYSEKFHGKIVWAHNTEYIAAKIQPYVYQITSDECLDLPPKIDDPPLYFYMTEEQRYWYEQVKNEFLDIDPNDFKEYDIFRLFTALQEVSCGFYNRIRRGKTEIITFPHKRVDYLMEAIARCGKNEQIVIWTKFNFDVQEITRRLAEEYGENSFSVYTGSISPKKRIIEEDKFFRGETRFFIGSFGCGARGLNKLVVSARVLYYDNVFKYNQRIQSEERSHRPEQKRPVVYRDIYCFNSIDERIAMAHARKSSIVEDFKAEVDKVKDKKVKFRELIKAL